MDGNAEDDRRILTDLIEAETLAFYSRNFQSWSAVWLQAETSRRLGAVAGGQLAMRRDNFNFRITPAMAWVSFDQYCKDNGDPFDSIGLSHDVRIFEKQDRERKLTFVGHDETNIGYSNFPVIRVDRKASKFWMNEAARNSLPDHSALVVIGGQLRARNRHDDKSLHEALAKAQSQSSSDNAPSASPANAQSSGIPVALNSTDDQISDICWISQQDGMFMVSFSDTEAEKIRLATAAKLYGLSPSQHRLAALIVSGQDVAGAVKTLIVGASTARTQLNRMFDKTNTRSQTALVRAFLSVEAPSR